jgi:hypothetical protein
MYTLSYSDYSDTKRRNLSFAQYFLSSNQLLNNPLIRCALLNFVATLGNSFTIFKDWIEI